MGFDIDESRQKYVLAEAGRLARNFRSYISRKYVRDAVGNVNVNPPPQYEISQADWASFLEVRLGEPWQVSSHFNLQFHLLVIAFIFS